MSNGRVCDRLIYKDCAHLLLRIPGLLNLHCKDDKTLVFHGDKFA